MHPLPRLPPSRLAILLALSFSWAACDTPPPPAAAPARLAVASFRPQPPSPAEPADAAASADGLDAALAPHAVPAERPPGAYANIDPTDDYVVGPPDALTDCDDRLAQAGIVYRPAKLAVHTEHKTLVCGAPQVVTYLRGPGKIAYEPPPLLTCSMALALASFERIVQQEAEREFRSPVAKVLQLGTYSCREIAAYPGWVSEHSYANAIDLSRFTLKNGKTVEVYRDFDVGEEPPAKRAGAFLRLVSQRAFDEEVFSHVLTPFFNAQHKNHFHLDLARYRGDGTRPQS
jgi:hypothetical protein